jgi:thymidylate kinase
MLVSLSGIDGSGKSSHSQALFDAFSAAGVETTGMTARIGRLTPLRLLIERLQKWRRRQRGAGEGAPARPSGRETSDQHWKGFPLSVWAILTAADYALWLQYVRWKLWRGEVVVADRYVCDFAVEFSILVKSQSGLARALLAPVRWVAPRPARSYYLRISPELSIERKPEDKHGYHHDEVVAGYDALYGRYGLILMDNTRPFDEVSREMVRDVLDTYRSRSR